MTLSKLLAQKSGKEKQKKNKSEVARPVKPLQSNDNYTKLKSYLHKKVISMLKEGPVEIEKNKEVLARRINLLVDKVIENENIQMPKIEQRRITEEIVDDTIGYGPITPFLLDTSISEIMVNGPKQIYIERNGKLELTDITFRDDEHVMNVIERIVAPIGRRVDESMPMVDARLPDGSRVNVIIPPLSLSGPVITIRKFLKDSLTMENLIKIGTLTAEMADFLAACVRARLNIIVSGGTGSGKTTTLNALSSFIPNGERIITIEDAAELKLHQEHVITLECRPPNLEGRGAVSVRDLVRNSLRMRPDRIIVGEVRGGEALDMLQAMNTGHDGSLTTGHANSPRDMLSRLETMVLMSGMDLPLKAVREQIASAMDLIIHQSRLRDGSRKITHITEVQGTEGDVILLQDIFTFHQTRSVQNEKINGEFRFSGIIPSFISKLETFKLTNWEE